MSTYLIRLKLVFEPTVLFPPAAVWGGGGIDLMVQNNFTKLFII